MKFLSRLLAASLLLTFNACKNTGNEKQPASVKDIAVAKTMNRNEEDKMAGGVLDSASAPQDNQNKHAAPQRKDETKEDWDKKIIKTATLSVEVKNYKSFNDMLHPVIKQLGGYIAQEEQNQSDYKIENVITVKIPVDKFNDAVAQLTPATEKIMEKKITSEDVTTEVIDTKSRMEAKKRVRDRYLDLLKQAKNMEEILQVQNEVNDIQEQVESAVGRIAYLDHSAAFSTINLTFYQVLNPSAGNTAEPSYGSRIAESFKSGLKWFGELFVVLVSLWPLWIGIIMMGVIIKKYRPSLAKKP